MPQKGKMFFDGLDLSQYRMVAKSNVQKYIDKGWTSTGKIDMDAELMKRPEVTQDPKEGSE